MNDLQKLIARIDSIGASLSTQWVLLTAVVVDCVTHYHQNDYETSALARLQDMLSYSNKSMADAYTEVLKQTTGVTFTRDYEELVNPDVASHSAGSLKKAIEKHGEWEATLLKVTDAGIKDYAPSKAKDAIKRTKKAADKARKAGEATDVTDETVAKADKADELQAQVDAHKDALIIEKDHPLYHQMQEYMALADQMNAEQARDMILADTSKLARALSTNTGDSVLSLLANVHEGAKKLFNLTTYKVADKLTA